MFEFWLSMRFLKGAGKFIGISSKLSITGLIIGVGVLLAAMAVVEGFQKTIKDSVIDLSGHIVLIKRGTYLSGIEELKKKINNTLPKYSSSPFIHAEAMLPHNGKVRGIMVQGIAKDGVREPSLKKRLVEGKWPSKLNQILVGKELAKQMDIKIGDSLKVVVPMPSKVNSNQFQPKLTEVEMSGIMDFGKYEYNERMLVGRNELVQKMLGLNSNAFSGLRIMLPNSDSAVQDASRVSQALGYPYYTRSWYELNLNFFEALKLEKMVLFIVLSVMVIAASFNTCSSLFISVVKRYRNISILKALGAGPDVILKIFSIQGLLIGFVGTFLGVLFGLFLVYLIANYSMVDMPADIYKIDRLPISLDWLDIAKVSCFSFIISFLASILPAMKASKTLPVEGLRYE
ncbi:MAG: ABC transporter permease [Bdellovibrionota bacterium]|nr:ABC transporter permease [Bdellovibrionota bacterium]